MNSSEESCSLCTMIKELFVDRRQIGATILRISVGIMMLNHGYPKLLFLLSGGGDAWLDPIGLGGMGSLLLSTFAEFICSAALILGLFTRFAALMLIINFWIIIFIYGAGNFWIDKELSTLYLICYISIFFSGAGSYSIDQIIKRKRDYKREIERDERSAIKIKNTRDI